MRVQSTLWIAAVMICFLPLAAQGEKTSVTSETRTFAKGWKGELQRVVAGHNGTMGLSYKNLDSGEEFSVNGDVMFPTASTIKLAVMCTAFDELSSPAGRLKDYYETRQYDESTSVSGAGFVQNYKDGRKVELKELLHFMITASDNVATNMLVEWLGLDSINNWLQRHGFEKTRMFSTIGGKLVWNKEGRAEWGLGVTTPNEMRHLVDMIRTGKAGTTSATEEMLRLMGHQYFDAGIPAGVPPWVWVGSKSGALNQSRSDNAIVASRGGTYTLSVYSKSNKDQSWGSRNEAENAIRRISEILYKHVNPKDPWVRPKGAEKL